MNQAWGFLEGLGFIGLLSLLIFINIAGIAFFIHLDSRFKCKNCKGKKIEKRNWKVWGAYDWYKCEYNIHCKDCGEYFGRVWGENYNPDDK